MSRRYAIVPSPVGALTVVVGDGGVEAAGYDQPAPVDAEEDATLEAAEQLGAWLRGERRAFELSLAPQGTPFQHEVWAALCQVPFGATTTYGELARAVGRDAGAARAVGAANGANPLAIVVPCHRVIGADGTLTGYAGGLQRKEWLLAFEGGGAQGRLF
jgi:methylated-DNA-[protein]-cysteine S-methyltransferase